MVVQGSVPALAAAHPLFYIDAGPRGSGRSVRRAEGAGAATKEPATIDIATGWCGSTGGIQDTYSWVAAIRRLPVARVVGTANP